MSIKSLESWALGAVLLALPLAACTPQEEPAEETYGEQTMATEMPAPPAMEQQGATAELQAASGSGISGSVHFEPTAGGVRVTAEVSGATPGMHGFHIHQNGECSGDFSSAGGHFNPTNTDHACPPTSPRHAGDLGNLEVGQDGTGHLDVTSDLISLDGADSVVGKAVIIHSGEDDCTSQPSGDSGSRIACGVVESDGGMGNGMGMDTGMDEGMDTAGGDTY